MKTCLLRVEPLTAERFRPFGQVLGPQRTTAGMSIGTGTYWAELLPAPEGELAIGVIRYHRRDLQIAKMERHPASGQSFIPLADGPSLLVVARGVDPDAPRDEPDLATLTGFVLTHETGVRVERGVWHVSPFPLGAAATYLMLAAPRTIEDGTDWRILPEPLRLTFTMEQDRSSSLRQAGEA